MTVHLYGNLRVIMGQSEMKLHWTCGTLREMIDRMAIQYGKTIREELFDEQGELDRAYALFIKGEQVDDLSLRIKDGEEVVVTSMLAGG